MPKVCLVCSSPNRLAVEEALVLNTPLRQISARFGFSTSALHRHRHRHLLQKLVKAEEAKQVSEAGTLLGKVESLIARCEDLARQAQENKSYSGASSALRELGRVLDLLGRVSGQLRSGVGVNVGILLGERPEEIKAGVDAKLSALLEM